MIRSTAQDNGPEQAGVSQEDHPEQAGPLEPGPSSLSEKLRTLPDGPGVYVMKDGGGRVLYVGKAASLRGRVRQYFQAGHADSPRIGHLVSKIRDVETVLCANVVEALILEATLIKRHHPWYNVRMADDKVYPYLKLTDDPFPKIVMTRKVVREGGAYFGPYPYHEPKLVGRTIRLIRRLFKLRTCNLEISGDLPRPCLDYYIEQCSAPCVAWGATKQQYEEQVRQATAFLQGKQEDLLRDLRAQMQAAGDATNFERAAQLRDQIRGLEALGERQRMVSSGAEDRDILNDRVRVERPARSLGPPPVSLRREDAARLCRSRTGPVPYVPSTPHIDVAPRLQR